MKLIKVLFGIILMAGIWACEDNYYTEGPIYYDLETRSIFYWVYPEDWRPYPDISNGWYDELTIDYIDDEVLDNGIVLFFVRSFDGADYWMSLPYTRTVYDNDIPFTQEFEAWSGYRTSLLQFYDSHPTTPLPPDWDMQIKVVIVRGTPDILSNVQLLKDEGHDAIMDYLDSVHGLNVKKEHSSK